MLDTITIFNSNPDLISSDKKSGAGQFSEVYLTPCGKYAIKHGNHGFADGWLLFAAKLLSMPEDERPWWAPTIHILRVDMDTGRFTALVRAYEHDKDGPTASGDVSDLMRVIEKGLPDLNEDEEYNEKYDDEYELLIEAHNFDNAPVECVEFLSAIEIETGVPLYYDMPGNSMWDATTERMVLNDPCCVKRWAAAKKDFRYKEKFWNFIYRCADTAPDMQLRGYR